MGANQGFLRPTGNLARREKTVSSSAPSQWETTPYPSNDLREGLTNSSARPSPAALRSPLTPAKAMKTATPAPVRPIPKQTPLTEEDWQLERPRRLIRREPEKALSLVTSRLAEESPIPDQPEEMTGEEVSAPVSVSSLPETPPAEPEQAPGAAKQPGHHGAAGRPGGLAGGRGGRTARRPDSRTGFSAGFAVP